MAQKKLIDLHWEWMETGRIKERNNPDGLGGICNAIPVDYLRKLRDFSPPAHLYKTYWGAENIRNKKMKMYEYTSLRQTIVLFICAMCGEI